MAGVNMTNQKRKTLLYKTGVEYGDYTINPYIGCSHGCTYPCYAYMMAHRFGKAKSITEWEDFNKKIIDQRRRDGIPDFR